MKTCSFRLGNSFTNISDLQNLLWFLIGLKMVGVGSCCASFRYALGRIWGSVTRRPWSFTCWGAKTVLCTLVVEQNRKAHITRDWKYFCCDRCLLCLKFIICHHGTHNSPTICWCSSSWTLTGVESEGAHGPRQAWPHLNLTGDSKVNQWYEQRA